MELERVKRETAKNNQSNQNNQKIVKESKSSKKAAKVDPNDLSNYMTGAEFSVRDNLSNAANEYYDEYLVTPEVNHKGKKQTSKGMLKAFLSQLHGEVPNVAESGQSQQSTSPA